MKKVLFVATVDSHIKAFHLPYLKMLHENGYEVHVATSGYEQFSYCDVKHQICIERSPFKLKNIRAIRQLKKIIEKEKFDLIHCHTPMGSVVCRLAARNARKKYSTRVVYTAHGFHFYKGAPKLNWLLFYPIEKYLAKYTDILITINQEDFKLAKNKFIKRCHDIQYLPGVGIDLKKYDFKMARNEKKEIRESLGLKEDDFLLIFPARLDKNKNQGFLINVMKKLVKNHPNIHLLLPGNDELNGYYQNMTKENNLEDNIHFLGYRQDIPQLMKISDVAVSSSLREGLPVNVIEAFAAGLPAVVLKCRGMNDLIVNNENGYIIENNKINEFVSTIIMIMEEKKKLRQISNNNKSKILEFEILDVVEKIKKIYFKRKKILHLLASNTFSGAENVVCTIIKNINKNYEAYYCSPQGSIEKILLEKGIPYIPIKKMSYKEIKKVIKRFNPDVIHAHDNRATVYASLFGYKCKIISHIHGNNKIMNSKNIKTCLFNFCSKNIKQFIWVSGSSLNDYYYKNNIVNKSIVLYNTIDAENVLLKSKEYVIKKKYDIIFLGRLAYPKNPERLIKIMKILKTMKEDISLAIVGDGVERKKIEELVRMENLEKNIEFFGYQKNPYPILKNSKILVLTSIYEGTPMCALEAQVLGKPIVATPVDGLKKLIKNDYNGFLTDDNNVFAKKIIEFLAKDCSNKVISSFKQNNDINKYISIIEEQY